MLFKGLGISFAPIATRPALALLGITLAAANASAAGFERVSTRTTPPIAAGIWYPAAAAPPAAPNTPFRQALALGAPMAGERAPLIVISHGDGGWMGGHAPLALALAEAGYVAVALEHPGNNSEDESASPGTWLQTRPRDISAILDTVLRDWRFSDQIDPARIGVFGFSAGGTTALLSAGALPDFAAAAEWCSTNVQEFVCRIGLLEGVDADALIADWRDNGADPRVRAISVAAPGFGFAFDADALRTVTVPVQVWSGGQDDRVPHETNGARVAAGLPTPAAVTVEPDAGHFAFLAPCHPRLETHNPRIWQMVCVDAPGFDRAAFQARLSASVVSFFDTAFGSRPSQ